MFQYETLGNWSLQYEVYFDLISLAKACETKLVCLAKAGEFSLKSLLDCGPLYASAFTCENLIKLNSADLTCQGFCLHITSLVFFRLDGHVPISVPLKTYAHCVSDKDEGRLMEGAD